jgi:Transposase DDE domain
VHLALLAQAGMHGVFRLHQRMVANFRIGRLHVPAKTKNPFFRGVRGLPRSRWVKWQGHLDQLVEYFKPQQRPAWMSAEAFAALPASMVVREIRYTIKQRGFRTRQITLVTTLLEPRAYPVEELAQLYDDRWRVELNLRHLKQTLRLDVLRTKTVAGVNKELRMLALAYNLVRLVMHRAAGEQSVPVERVSFIDALRWLAHAASGSVLRPLIVNPNRAGRIEPRVKKRRPKEYDLMKRPRAELKQALMRQSKAA